MSSKPKASRTKTLKPESRADKHGVSFRLSDAELRLAQSQLMRIQRDAGITIKLGSYAKHATAEHARLRAIEVQLRELSRDLARGECKTLPDAQKRIWVMLEQRGDSEAQP